MRENELISIAKDQLKYSYAPYSKFHVGAALLSSDGKIFTGCNIENASFGASNCAERTAVFKAVSEGTTDFTAIAVVSSADILTYPCGICRQVLAQFSPEIKIILEGKNEGIKTFTLSELLPYGFTL